MAQSTSNKVQSTNPMAGLLGLTPKPKAPSSVFGGPQTSTPAMSGTSAFTAPAQKNMTPSPVASSQQQMNVPAQASAPVRGMVSPTQSSINPQITQQPQPTQAQLAPTFPGLVGQQQTAATQAVPITGQVQQSLMGAASRSPVAEQYAQQTAQYGAGNIDIGNQAAQIAQQYGNRITNIGQAGTKAAGGYETTGTSPVAEGNAGVIARNTAALQSAQAAGGQMALQGTAQRLTGQGQAATAANAAAGQANTGLGYQQAGLINAGNLGVSQQNATTGALNNAATQIKPEVTGYGQTSFDPATGQFGGAGDGGLPAGVMQQYAQMAATGQYSSIPSFITSNPVLSAQLNVAAKGLNPKYTPIGSQGAGQVLGNIPALTSANTAAEGIKNTIQSYLQANPQLNSSELAAGNVLQQWIQGKQLTDPKYQTLFNYLDEYTNTLAPILGVGGNPTNLKTEIAQGFINAAASGQSISEVLNSMSMLATNKIQDIQSGALGGGTSVPAPTKNPQRGSGMTTGFAETW